MVHAFKDDHFSAEYNNYVQVREQGLKKQGNQMLAKLMDYFDTLDKATQREICYKFCCLMDDEKVAPNFFVTQRLISILKEDYEQNKMPQMRWYYVLTMDTDNSFILEKAYAHPECDMATAELMVNWLDYRLHHGIHHLPDYILLQ
jgi:hypothetical protein